MAQTNSEKIETLNGKIFDTEKEIQQLKNKEKRLMQAGSNLERKARTHRLIQRGAMLESLIPEAETLTNEELQSVLLAAFHTTAAIETLKKAREPAATVNSLV